MADSHRTQSRTHKYGMTFGVTVGSGFSKENNPAYGPRGFFIKAIERVQEDVQGNRFSNLGAHFPTVLSVYQNTEKCRLPQSTTRLKQPKSQKSFTSVMDAGSI